jgi:hypothetical protein
MQIANYGFYQKYQVLFIFDVSGICPYETTNNI